VPDVAAAGIAYRFESRAAASIIYMGVKIWAVRRPYR
jgi:hypothetical protein